MSYSVNTTDFIIKMNALSNVWQSDNKIQYARAANPAVGRGLQTQWQQMQYLLGMFSVQDNSLDNAHYL